jgi:hypothetical protein
MKNVLVFVQSQDRRQVEDLVCEEFYEEVSSAQVELFIAHSCLNVR